jgi:hypothetical protein
MREPAALKRGFEALCDQPDLRGIRRTVTADDELDSAVRV